LASWSGDLAVPAAIAGGIAAMTLALRPPFAGWSLAGAVFGGWERTGSATTGGALWMIGDCGLRIVDWTGSGLAGGAFGRLIGSFALPDGTGSALEVGTFWTIADCGLRIADLTGSAPAGVTSVLLVLSVPGTDWTGSALAGATSWTIADCGFRVVG
jgi:hypothetical protein